MKASPQQVNEILGAELDESTLAPFIATARARLIVAKQFLDERHIDNGTRSLIAAWLTCHYLALSPVGKSVTLMASEETFENWTVKNSTSQISGNAEGVQSTFYGRNANDLAQGALTETKGRRKFKITYL